MPAVKRHNAADADQARGALPNEPATDAPSGSISLSAAGSILWDLKNPRLCTVHVELLENNKPIDEDSRRLGFREATLTDQGFLLNGKIVKLHGRDRHQTFPWVGQAMSDRGQKQDAKMLRYDCRCNIVRTSDYPQSSHFLDACDEIGLLALEEIPGWQYIGDVAWQDVTVDNAHHRKSLRANRLPGVQNRANLDNIIQVCTAREGFDAVDDSLVTERRTICR